MTRATAPLHAVFDDLAAAERALRAARRETEPGSAAATLTDAALQAVEAAWEHAPLPPPPGPVLADSPPAAAERAPSPAAARAACYAELRAISQAPRCGAHFTVGCRRCQPR